MTTSNSTDFTITADECIRLALEEIGIIGEGDGLEDYDYGRGKAVLNLMIKAWQNQGNHLWVRQKAVLFLQKEQPSYEISTTSSDNITADTVAQTQLSSDGAISDVVIDVADSSSFASGYFIGVQLDTGSFFWTTVFSVIDPTSIQLTAGLPSAASTGRYVFGYQTKLTNTFNLRAVTRRLIGSEIDIPLIFMSYHEYIRLPNKLTPGTPNSYSYDRQVDDFLINIWQNPADVSYYLDLVLDRKIQDIDINSNTFDLPQEWSEAIVLNLALRLAPSYGKAQGENFQELKVQARESLVLALENDNELGSIYIIPARSGIRGNT